MLNEFNWLSELLFEKLYKSSANRLFTGIFSKSTTPNGRGTPGNTGDGFKMAQKAGAALWHRSNSLAGVGCIIVPEYDPVLIPVSFPRNSYILVDKTGKRFMNEMRENRHGFGHKENLLYFDGVLGEFTRIPCYGIFDETARTSGSVAGGGKLSDLGKIRFILTESSLIGRGGSRRLTKNRMVCIL